MYEQFDYVFLILPQYVHPGRHGNPGISYSYYIPGNGKSTTFKWKQTINGECSTTCAGGRHFKRYTSNIRLLNTSGSRRQRKLLIKEWNVCRFRILKFGHSEYHFRKKGTELSLSFEKNHFVYTALSGQFLKSAAWKHARPVDEWN